jgi:LacI family transcriptional regulator
VSGELVRRPTIQDVAREAGVSPSTVSRALNGSGYAAADVRRRVWDAAERIGYVPDVNARSLRHRTSRAVGVLVSDLRNPFYATLAAGIEEQLRPAGMHMVLSSNDGDSGDGLDAARTLVAMRVAGVVMTPASAESVDLLRKHGVPVVQVDRRIGRSGDAVLSTNEAAARELTEHLLDLGHRRIALLIDETRWSTGKGRLAGYRQAHEARGLTVDDSLIEFASFDAAAAIKATNRLFTEHPDVTAVFAANNVLAQGAFTELAQLGLRVPADVSLVAYDDVPWMSMVQPAVTTISQHTEEMGARAARLLLSRLDGTNTGPSKLLRVPASVVMRASTAAATR